MGSIIKEDVDRWHDASIYVKTRTLYLGGSDEGSEINYRVAERFIKNLHVLEVQSEQPIMVIMNSPGGSVVDGLAIYDAICLCKCHITIKVFGHAQSMGSIILQAADERLVSPNSSVMLHYGTERYSETHSKDVLKNVMESERVNVWMENLFLSKIHEKLPNYKKSQLKRKLVYDWFLTGAEAVSLGLADKVLER